MLDKSMLDNDKIGFLLKNEDQSINQSTEVLNVGDFILVPGTCEDRCPFRFHIDGILLKGRLPLKIEKYVFGINIFRKIMKIIW